MKRSTQPPKGYKRLNINIEEQLLNRFKSAAALDGFTMSDVLLKYIQHYVDTQGKRRKKARR